VPSGIYPPPTWLCSQIGAREHYAIPNALHQQGRLAGLVTDWYAPHAKALQWVIKRWPAALAARSEMIPDGLVRAFPLKSLFWKRKIRRLSAQGQIYEAFLQTDAAFTAATANLKLPAHDIFFGYSYASLEMLIAEKKRGVLTVLDQIDPSALEFRLVAEEMSRFPGLAGAPPEFPAKYYERNEREWEAADRIVVNSAFCRDALIQQGVNPAKLLVVPLCYEPKGETPKTGAKHQKPGEKLRILFLGQVILRKGIQYLLEAARILEKENVHFDIVGPLGISAEAVAAAPRNVTFHGRATRDQAATWYRQADLFVLPTLSDGFAITQLEAMSYGLPVITTPCCGEVVSDSVDGFIVPSRNAAALAQKLERYLTQPEIVPAHSASALLKAREFTLNRLWVNLMRLEADLSGSFIAG
jgi:glycosyltransferase involved in cell wall biosynthesis